MDDDRIEIDNFDHFYRFSRMIAFCNMELSMNPKSREIKDDLIEQHIEDSSYLIDTDELEELITLAEISEIIDPYIRKDNISHEFYVRDEDTHIFTSKISYEMFLRLYKNLEELGYLELCWDPEKDDFVYRKTSPPTDSH